MATISTSDRDDARQSIHRAKPFLSVFVPTTLVTAFVSAGQDRGARTVTLNSASGQHSDVVAGQMVYVGTTAGSSDVDILIIKDYNYTGPFGAATIDFYENSVVWTGGYHITIKQFYPIESFAPRIDSSGVLYTRYDQTYASQNDPGKKPNPVCIAGADQVALWEGSNIDFDFDLSGSYTLAAGATINSYSLTVEPSTGASVSFNTGTGVGTITASQAGQWWATCQVTDSNSKTSIRYVALIADASPYFEVNMTSHAENYGGGISFELEVFGDADVTDFPREALCILWYQNYLDDTEQYINLFDVGDNILDHGYIASESWQDDLGNGTHSIRFRCESGDNVLDNIYLDPVVIEAKQSPSSWLEYGPNLTVGRAIHHLLFWYSTLPTRADLIGLTDNALLIKLAKFEGSTLRQMCNTLARERGIFAALTADRMGRLHLATDSQMLNTAGRAALDTIYTITEADISGSISTVYDPTRSAYAAQLSGAYYDGGSTTFYISLIPGYQSGGTSYGIPARRGSTAIVKTNQVLASQADSNEKVGRIFAAENRPIREFRMTFRGNYVGILTTICTQGFYVLGIANSTLARELAVNSINLICRQITLQQQQNGDLVTNAVFEPEAIGPDGIPGNYPKTLPQPTVSSNQPDWESPEALAAILSGSSMYYRDDNASDWTTVDSSDLNHACLDVWWRVKTQNTNPEAAIWLACGDSGLVIRMEGINDTLETLTPQSDPSDDWSEGQAATDLTMIQIMADVWQENRFYVLAEQQESSNWRGWLLYSDDNCQSYTYVSLWNSAAPTQVRPLWMAVNSTQLLVTVWNSTDGLNVIEYDPSDLSYVGITNLGAATATEVADRDKYAFPVAVFDDDDTWYIAGRMVDPDALSGTYHIIETTNGGTTFSSFENGWSTDYCAALVVGLDDGAGNRDYWAVRQDAGA